MKWLTSILYGLFVIWTGLLSGIQAQAYKPNSFWFCLLTGLACIGAGYLFRLKKDLLGLLLGLVSSSFVLGFYLLCFVNEPEKDATIRVGLVIVASIGFMALVCLPPPPNDSQRNDDSCT